MKISRTTTLILVTALGALALAKGSFVKEFANTYGVKPTSTLGKASCGACHVGKTPKLNPYGMDLQKAMRTENTKILTGSVLKKVEGIDSDKDGATNLTEIKADKLPGDPKSK
jgi:hypothetical protein